MILIFKNKLYRNNFILEIDHLALLVKKQQEVKFKAA